ncbi:transcription termination factor, RNA polymerase II [Branchiostoma belcheri]|nr:transcription termination factor, RNA polymerase II [Branchiostoma belcheri]
MFMIFGRQATIVEAKVKVKNGPRIPVKEWESVASDRRAWRAATREGAVKWEKARKDAAEEKRRRRKATVPQPTTAATFTCPSCRRTCGSRIGLHSHMKACSHMKD